MAETEKEGRPPENKRSRKPAHPVKREINEEMKSFAESTMNELLGWYGYDKVELRDSDNLDIGETAQHISVLKENMLPKLSAASEGGDGSPDDRANSSHSLPASRNGHSEAYIAASTSIPGNKEHGNPPIAVPMIPPPLIKPPADEDGTNVQIMCAWCQKVGVKRYSLSMGSELKSFCSEKCFAACRRAYFKRNKLGYVRSYTARDDDGFGGKLPQLSFTQDTARLVCKTNGDVLVCDWCKHIRHTKEYLDFGAGERRLQFCSAKCLNQYKMDIFYKETQAALPGALCNPSAVGDGKGDCGGGVQLLTPESWGTPLSELRRKAPSPLGPSSSLSLAACSSSASSPPHTVCSPTSSVSARMSTPRQHESPTLPPPPMTLHPGVGVPPVSPPMVMTPRGPMPLPLFMEHQMMQQIRPPFLRPSNHPGGPNSPLPNPIIPGIGPPPPTRNHGAASNPMHRPLISSHVHPSSNPNPGMMPPHPGLSMPGMPPFPPFNMLPNGHIPFSPMMNFGMPSLAPLVPPPSLLVPYPVIVPLPIPIPIPIPIPLSPKSFKETLEGRDPKPSAPESSDSTACGLHSQDNSGGDKIGKKLDMVSTESQSPERSQINRPKVVESRVKAENSLRNTCQDSGSSQMDGVIDLTIGQRLCQQLAQRILPGVQVKVEAESESRSPPLGKERVCGFGAEETLSLLRGTELLGSKHFQTKEKSCPAFINGSSFDSCPPTDNLTSPLLTTATAVTQSESLPQLQPSPAAPCNVIVNGTGWHSLNEFEPFSEPNGGGVISEGRINGDLEKEALKENNCSRKCEWDCGKRGPVQDEITDAVVGKQDPDCVDEGEHAYSLPLLSTGGCVVIQPVPKPGMDKTAILSCSITAPISASESPELEPPLKRRCLRIRNQNK